jgi:hypothetical protein
MNVTFWEEVQSERIGRHTMNILTDERNGLLLSAANA